MAQLINLQGLVTADPWRWISTDAALSAATKDMMAAPATERHLVLTLPLWQTHGDELAGQGHPIGVWLWPEDEPEALIPVVQTLPIIAVHFPVFTDGRGYSHGKLLRERLGYTGDLRATGDILRDQIYFLSKCGFSSFALRADQSSEECLAALNDYSWSPLSGSLGQ